MTDIAIKVEGIGKKYQIGKKKSGEIRESFGNLIQLFKSKVRSQEPTANSSFWALKDISFEIKQGEAVGIIGRNGAGKSTLLKVLSRITKPSTGRFEINGRVSSLLEVGTGFHPELTGRENIYLNGTILGMRRAEIKTKFDEIISFSGVEEFVDTPVKHYSSGMKVRLAFSVAAHLEPEILIIDEVLAVGDVEFQKKCLGKMEDVTGQGRTVLFVSHNMGAVRQLCQHGIVLKKGKLSYSGLIDEVINHYNQEFTLLNPCTTTSTYLFESDEVQLYELSISSNGQVKNKFLSTDEILLTFKVLIKKPIRNFRFGIEIEDQNSIKIFSSYHNDINDFDFGTLLKSGPIELLCKIPPSFFNEGTFYINLLFGVHNERWIYKIERSYNFSIIYQSANRNIFVEKRKGLLAPILDWDYKQ